MALIRRIGFTRFSRFGENLGRLDVRAAKHTDALDGTDELAITCADDLAKGDRIVWLDFGGKAHEHIVDSLSRTHDSDGQRMTEATCINSINETWDDYVEDKRPSGTADVALQSVLSGTRWSVGTCDVKTSTSHTFYHESVREAIGELLDAWGGELETSITVDGPSVSGRSVGIRALRGDQSSPKRFVWTKDLVSVKRSVASDNPKSRIYGYGKGVETDTGGYGRRLTFGDVNGGKDYVEDTDAHALWGHPASDGTVAPSVGVFVDENCDDAATLLQETKDYLESVKEPKVTYEADVIDLYAFGRSWERVETGDSVAIIDRGFTDDGKGIRLKGRVTKTERDLLTGGATVTFGNLTDQFADMWESVAQSLRSSSSARATYDAAAAASPGWLTLLQGALNDQFNNAGTYKVETFGLGAIYSNVPLDTNTGLPLNSTSSMWAVNINGAGIRLASSLTSSGNWDWKTFITGSQVVADCINAGTMKANRIRAGLLTDEKGSNYWNLDTGEFSLAATAKVGGKTVGSIANDAVSAQTQQSIFNKLTNNGQTQGIYLSGGKLYINATYMKAGIISDSAGSNTWNLSTGALTTNYMTAKNMTATGSLTSGTDTSYKAEIASGHVRFYYNSQKTIELVSIPSYTDGSKGGYLQACSGATYLGLRAPKLYTATNTSEAGTIGYTGSVWLTGFDSSQGDGWSLSNLKLFEVKFKNGIEVNSF